MELKWLLDFVSLANSGSFSKAAEDRHVTQSAFSRRIRSLEDWLGTTLVDRTSHPISLTNAGYRFVETANQTIRILYKVREDFSTTESGKRPTLTIGITNHLSVYFFPAWFKSMEKDLGDFRFRLSSSIKGGVDFYESLKHQEFDLLIVYGDSISPISLDASKYESIQLGEDILLPVCSRALQNRELFQFPGTPEKPIPYLSYMNYSSVTKMIHEVTTNSLTPFYFEKVIETSTAEAIKSMVMEDFGVGWLPKSTIEQELEQGEVIVLGEGAYNIPLKVEIYRYMANIKPEIMNFWDRLSKIYQT
ncbi:LysR family transcriptional regulator [bacterium SCSIO 12696]|nr:LysR family transcriptional regulator [bacterium SCSIO 12696]